MLAFCCPLFLLSFNRVCSSHSKLQRVLLLFVFAGSLLTFSLLKELITLSWCSSNVHMDWFLFFNVKQSFIQEHVIIAFVLSFSVRCLYCRCLLIWMEWLHNQFSVYISQDFVLNCSMYIFSTANIVFIFDLVHSALYLYWIVKPYVLVSVGISLFNFYSW